MNIINQKEIINLLSRKGHLTIKVGFDPTNPDLHLGHYILLKELCKFQTQGHKVILIIGDFTATIGDPSGKPNTRQALSADQAIKNSQTYILQVLKILQPNLTSIKYNSEWLAKLNLKDILSLCSKYSLNKIIERRDFNKRITSNKPVYVHEIMYPLLQAYDSVIVKPDI